MVVTQHVSQACNDKREVVPTLEQIGALPAVLGEVHTLITDNGYFSQANVIACRDAGVEPLLALKREAHHAPVLERFAPDVPPPQTTDPVVQMAHRLGTQAGRALYSLRKQTVEPVFGIIKRVMGWRQMTIRPRGDSPAAENARSARHSLKSRVAPIHRIRSDSSPTDS